MAKSKIPTGTGLYPVPVVLVSCRAKPGERADIVTVAWCGVACSEPPILSIALRPSRYSNRLIKESREFAINIPPVGLALKADMCGMVSGADIDKFQTFSLTEQKALRIQAPIIGECPVSIECELLRVIPLGSHELFLGKVLAVSADSSVLDDSGSIDFEKAAPFVYNQGEYRVLGAIIGRYGFSSKK